MKNKGLLVKLLACICMIPCFVIPFIAIFNSQVTAGNTVSTGDGFGLFADYSALADLFKVANNQELATLWMFIVSVLVIALAVAALAYILTVVLELGKSKCKNLAKFNKLAGFTVFGLAVAALVVSILATIINTATGAITGTVYKLIFDLGAWLLIAPVVGGLLALLAPKTKAKKGKKK